MFRSDRERQNFPGEKGEKEDTCSEASNVVRGRRATDALKKKKKKQQLNKRRV